MDGTLSVSSADDYQLYLDGVTIIGNSGPALDLESSQKVSIATASGTTNVLMDSASRDMTMKAALYGKGPMVFSGEGTLMATGSYKHGIFSKDYIHVQSGELDVAVSAKDAVRSVNGFIFDDGDLTINAAGTDTDDESKGIKVEGSEGSDGAGKGYIVINGGYLYCACSDNDAIVFNGSGRVTRPNGRCQSFLYSDRLPTPSLNERQAGYVPCVGRALHFYGEGTTQSRRSPAPPTTKPMLRL